jgi:hypothetical protein
MGVEVGAGVFSGRISQVGVGTVSVPDSRAGSRLDSKYLLAIRIVPIKMINAAIW